MRFDLLILLLMGSLVASFIAIYVLPSVFIKTNLSKAQKILSTLSLGASKEEISNAFQHDKRLLAVWKEYEKTLHTSASPDMLKSKTAVFATSSAQTYFNNYNLIDNSLKIDFFSNLPGILTGLGILGTFLGLSQGLDAFASSITDIKNTRSSLEQLMGSIGHAFKISTWAILGAMLITFFEKLRFSVLSSHISALAETIDSLFIAGAKEDYLSRLVALSSSKQKQSSDASNLDLSGLTNSLGTLESLSPELSSAIKESSNAQIIALQNHAMVIGEVIKHCLNEACAVPMRKLTETIQSGGNQHQSSDGQTANPIELLGQQLNDTIGKCFFNLIQIHQKESKQLRNLLSDFIENQNTENHKEELDISQQHENKNQIEQTTANQNAEQIEAINKLQDMLSTFSQQQFDVVTNLTKKIDESIDKQSMQIHQPSNFDDSIMTTMVEYLNTLQATTITILGNMSKYTEQLADTTLKLDDAGQKLLKVIKKISDIKAIPDNQTHSHSLGISKEPIKNKSMKHINKKDDTNQFIKNTLDRTISPNSPTDKQSTLEFSDTSTNDTVKTNDNNPLANRLIQGSTPHVTP